MFDWKKGIMYVYYHVENERGKFYCYIKYEKILNERYFIALIKDKKLKKIVFSCLFNDFKRAKLAVEDFFENSVINLNSKKKLEL